MSAGGMSASAGYQDIKTKGAPVAVDEEYLKKVLKNDSHTSPISTWQQSPLTPREPLWGDNNVTARVRKSSDTGDDTFLAQKENSIPNDDDNIFNTYL